MDKRSTPESFKPEPSRPDPKAKPNLKRNLPLWEMLLDLPLLNRWLLGSGATLLAIGVLSLIGPPTASSVSTAVRPYTAGGKEEKCLTNLRTIGIGLLIYGNEHQGRYPILEQTSSGKNGSPANRTTANRTTWVSLLRRSNNMADVFLCPQGGGDGETTSSYGFNAALSGAKMEEIANPEQVIVLAERSDGHDLAILPPLEGWQSNRAEVDKTAAGKATADKAATDSNTAQSSTAQSSNLDFRHGNRVAVLFADGHTRMLEAGPWLHDLKSWGGALAVKQARLHLLQTYPLLQQVQATRDKSGEASAVTFLRQQAVVGKEFEKAMQTVQNLWVQNDGANFDAETDKWGWQLAKWANKAGQTDLLPFFDQEQSRRCAVLLKDAKESAADNAWQKQETHGSFLSIPASWTRNEETEGRYHRVFFRSASPHISVQVEHGERTKPGPEAGIEWSGIEDEFEKTYGSRYKRVTMGTTTLAGEVASLWEFEIDRKDAPKLHKLYVGRSHLWNSVIFTATAPAQDFASWKPLFEQIKESLQRN